MRTQQAPGEGRLARRLMSVSEVAEFLGVTRSLVYNKWTAWVDQFGLHVVRLNGNPNSPPRFWSHEIQQMAIAWETVTR